MKLGDKQIAFIGVGHMGFALLKGLLDSNALPASQIRVNTRRAERAQALAAKHGVVAAKSSRACVEGADIVLLAVKPQIMTPVLRGIAGALKRPLLLSVAAGIDTARIETEIGGQPRVVRAMPNTPSRIKQGATALCAGQHATEADLDLAEAILKHVGRVVRVDEIHMDAVTGLSGSGPAYVFLIIDSFCDAGVKVGLSREVALELAVQTIQGSARLLQETQEHPGRLKDEVTSPGGTAIAGLHTLEEGGLRTTIMNAVEAATRRSKELGRETPE